MNRIINKRTIECTLFGLGALAVLGFKYKGPDTEIPKNIGELTIDTFNNKEVVPFSEIEDIDVYMDYTINGDNIFYGSSLLKEVDGDNYKAYYNYKSGNLFTVEFDELSLADKKYYKNYLNTYVIKISSLEDQLTNPNNIKIIRDGIHFDEEYIDYSTLKLMDASMIPHNKQVFEYELDNVTKEKKLTR